MDDDQSDWVLELEEALLDEAPPEHVKVLVAGRPLPPSLRTDIWAHCLETSCRRSRLETFDYVYDLPDQPDIRAAAQSLAEDRPLPEDRLQVTSDVESILTVHLKSTGQRFDKRLLHIVRPVIDLSLNKNEKYTIFNSLVER